MTTEPLRWGLIGSGLIAGAFDKDMAVTDSGRVVAIGSRNQESADRFADEFHISNRHASYEALVTDPAVDVVYVATPHPMHHDSALLALDAGKPEQAATHAEVAHGHLAHAAESAAQVSKIQAAKHDGAAKPA